MLELRTTQQNNFWDRKKIYIRIIFVLCVVIGVFVYGLLQQKKESESQVISTSMDSAAEQQQVLLGDVTVKVDIADTSASRQRGLSGRRALGDDDGMLFVFDEPGKYSFWMKDMNFPIDIVWIAENLDVVGIEKNVHPNTYPSTFEPKGEIMYVLEVPGGWVDTNNISERDSLQIPKNTIQ